MSGEDDFERAVSRILSAPFSRTKERIIYLCSQYPKPGRFPGPRSGPLLGFLFGLAPDGVFRASAIALGAVGSYPTLSPLPAGPKPGRRSVLCGTFRRLVLHQPPACIPCGLRGVAPCGVRTFLPPFPASDSPPFQSHKYDTLRRLNNKRREEKKNANRAAIIARNEGEGTGSRRGD